MPLHCTKGYRRISSHLDTTAILVTEVVVMKLKGCSTLLGKGYDFFISWILGNFFSDRDGTQYQATLAEKACPVAEILFHRICPCGKKAVLQGLPNFYTDSHMLVNRLRALSSRLASYRNVAFRPCCFFLVRLDHKTTRMGRKEQ